MRPITDWKYKNSTFWTTRQMSIFLLFMPAGQALTTLDAPIWCIFLYIIHLPNLWWRKTREESEKFGLIINTAIPVLSNGITIICFLCDAPIIFMHIFWGIFDLSFYFNKQLLKMENIISTKWIQNLFLHLILL